MITPDVTTLTVADRVAIVKPYDLTDTATMQLVCSVLKVDSADLEAAIGLAEDGFSEGSDINIAPYQKLFDADILTKAAATAVASPSQTSIANPASTKPATASKHKKTPKPRGRKGVKIKKAFIAAPVGQVNAIPVTEYAKTHDVSFAVLRQANRFDVLTLPDKDEYDPTAGIVRCMLSGPDNVLSIWRESAETVLNDGEETEAAPLAATEEVATTEEVAAAVS